MTKRPDKETFLKDWEDYSGDINSIAYKYGVTIQSVYNWIQIYVNDVVGEEEEEELTYDDYAELFTKNINKPAKRDFQVSLKNGILIAPMSDIHLGSKFTNVPRLTSDLNIIRDTPNVYATFAGDLVDYTSNGPKDLLYDQVFANPKHARDWARTTVEKIQHKMLAMVSGCHDDWYYKETGEYLLESIAKKTITRIFAPDALSLDINVGEETYKIEMSHKLRYNSSYNISHSVFRKAAREVMFDVGIVAHRHTPGIAVQNIRGQQVVAINCGGYKNLDTYAGKLGISPHPSWIPGFYLHADKHCVVPFTDWTMGLTYMRGL